jgi:hypothetical protein
VGTGSGRISTRGRHHGIVIVVQCIILHGTEKREQLETAGTRPARSKSTIRGC